MQEALPNTISDWFIAATNQGYDTTGTQRMKFVFKILYIYLLFFGLMVLLYYILGLVCFHAGLGEFYDNFEHPALTMMINGCILLLAITTLGVTLICVQLFIAVYCCGRFVKKVPT